MQQSDSQETTALQRARNWLPPGLTQRDAVISSVAGFLLGRLFPPPWWLQWSASIAIFLALSLCFIAYHHLRQ